FAQDALSYVEENGEDASKCTGAAGTIKRVSVATAASPKTCDDNFTLENIDFDGKSETTCLAVYEDDEEDELEDVKEHGSIIMHMLSQLSVGMDLTKITLPTFILERRSLLEMFADFFAHPDLFARITDQSDPEERMLAVVKWYLSSFHAGRKSSVAKKPYNPIIGETFRCRWDVPRCADGKDIVSDGPYPGSQKDHLTFLAEQVSHHPPVSAFYAEHPIKNVYVNGHIWTKSKFLGLSIAVHNVGQACLNLPDHNEQYILTFPSGYGRSILGTPWIELGGKCSIKCEKSGYLANIEFLTKPFYGGRAHNIKGEIYRPNAKTPFATIKGQWNGQMFIKMCNNSEDKIFLDVHQIPVVKKLVAPISQQGDFESRKLWRHVTAALKQKNVHLATKAKQFLEQRQRQEAKDRAEKNVLWCPANFSLDNHENWVYNHPLYARKFTRKTNIDEEKAPGLIKNFIFQCAFESNNKIARDSEKVGAASISTLKFM
uniref:Oxysterol-binding protein n=1 Tax=Romanomermis culicivorax TaxID=13658 RepID=A0A915KGJ6_ROMCU